MTITEYRKKKMNAALVSPSANHVINFNTLTETDGTELGHPEQTEEQHKTCRCATNMKGNQKLRIGN